jgi:hypothetical protein
MQNLRILEALDLQMWVARSLRPCLVQAPAPTYPRRGARPVSSTRMWSAWRTSENSHFTKFVLKLRLGMGNAWGAS